MVAIYVKRVGRPGAYATTGFFWPLIQIAEDRQARKWLAILIPRDQTQRRLRRQGEHADDLADIATIKERPRAWRMTTRSDRRAPRQSIQMVPSARYPRLAAVPLAFTAAAEKPIRARRPRYCMLRSRVYDNILAEPSGLVSV